MSAGPVEPGSSDTRGAGRLKAAAGIVRVPGARPGDIRGEDDLIVGIGTADTLLRGGRYGDSEGVLDGDSRGVRDGVPPPVLISFKLAFR